MTLHQAYRSVIGAALACLSIAGSLASDLAPPTPEEQLTVRISWGQESRAQTRFYVRCQATDAVIDGLLPRELEPDDTLKEGLCQTQAGGGDIDGLEFTLRFPQRQITAITNLQTIWAALLAQSDADTVRRLQCDPGYRPDTRKLTVQMNAEGTRGFSVTVDQLLADRVFWVPALDVFLTAGEPTVSYADQQKELAVWRGRRVLDQVHQEPEASYEQFTARWEDMGSPRYKNPAAPPPGHIVGLTWDSALYKFGIDRGAGVRNDLGNPDHFRFSFDFGEPSPDWATAWKGQKLTQGFPVITTIFEKDGVRYEVEQFAYPLHGPPSERRGDIPMVLLQKLKVSELEGRARTVPIWINHARELPGETGEAFVVQTQGDALIWEEVAAHGVLLTLDGPGFTLQSNLVAGTKWKTNAITVSGNVPAKGSRELVFKLPSPVVPASDRDQLLKLDYASARAATLSFWSEYLARGAQFKVPEEAVNELFRANLWHALRLPRRHGGQGANIAIDLPYSNFAYDQKGTPWPVNQAIYVDYMIYDLRGYHAVSAEELATIFRNNQEPNGHVGGFANWGVYTPSMIYTVAKHYLLTGDRAALDALLPQTLKALDWCLAEMQQADRNPGPTRGLILAPLNDLSHDARAWAFNQAYLFAGVDLLGRVLTEIQHPRAPECRAAAQAMFQAIARGFGQATMAAPLVQLRDHTWVPYVPCDALTPRRLLEIWYPTDVDTGALHLSRLRALDPVGPLTTYLLNDHEDNLFLKGWGMANEPVYNQQATAYLLRDDAKAAIRAFYSMMACAFSHSTFEPVEHRWTWGQYFGPPSTDGAWFELYRNMLIHERDDDTLVLLQATPRKWLEDGKAISVQRAPTYYGPLTMDLESHVAAGEISASLDLPTRKRPQALLVRFRHPQGQAMRSVSVNGQDWKDFDAQKEWVRIPHPISARYAIVAHY